MITHTDLGVEDDLARRIMVRARIIAPCIDHFPDGSEEQKNAIAILKGVIQELPAAGEARLRSISRNGTAVTLADIASAFDGDPAVSLRSLCGDGAAAGDVPLGSFPEATPLSRIFREGAYT